MRSNPAPPPNPQTTRLKFGVRTCLSNVLFCDFTNMSPITRGFVVGGRVYVWLRRGGAGHLVVAATAAAPQLRSRTHTGGEPMLSCSNSRKSRVRSGRRRSP